MPSGTKARLCILASGGGSNAEAICNYFKDHPAIEVVLILSNRLSAGVHQIAERHHVPSQTLPAKEWTEGQAIVSLLKENTISHIVLAGFLLMIPESILAAYPNRIVNIHPSLLPAYGGKGMYGHHVHEAVHSAKEEVTGLSIHLVNQEYDDGEILFQAQVTISPADTPEQIAHKVLRMEHYYFPRVIEAWILQEPMPN